MEAEASVTSAASWRERARDTFNHAWIPAKTFFQFGAILYATKTYVVDVTMCLGPSMRPTFSRAGDIVLIAGVLFVCSVIFAPQGFYVSARLKTYFR